jgi:tellurite resistance protein
VNRRKGVSDKETKGSGIDKYAAPLRAGLASLQQEKLFRAAVEAGYLTALADNRQTPEERASLVRSLSAISTGAVIEWEVDALLEEVAALVGDAGAEARAAAVGAALKELDQVEAGLSVAALVALASRGLDKKEAAVLERIGAAAGLSKQDVAGIVKKARGL